MKKLAIITTHPIQYHFPVFQLLAKQCRLKVFYTWGIAGVDPKYDPDFRKEIIWDLPFLEDYDYELLENIAPDPGSHHGKGIVNPDIIKKIDAFTPDAILVYGYIYHSHLQVMRHFKGKIPIWFRGDSTLLNNLPLYKKIIKNIYLRWIYNQVDIAFYVGLNNKAYFKQFGLKEEQLVFAPHAIDNDRFAIHHNAEAAELRKKLNIPQQELVFLFAGKLEPNKNPKLLLKEFTSAVEENRNQPEGFISNIRKAHLLFVGNGVLEDKLKSQVGNLNSQVHFLEFQNQTQMPIVYQACDIFCLPSMNETWGLAVNEAMAAGKAIIVSDQVGCAIDLVKPGINGFIFKLKKSKELRELMSYFIKNPRESMMLGEKSREIISSWCFNQQVNTLIRELNKIR
ncbi:hypothetical protein GCM10022246_07860 [Pedobacter ginsengiterrae]|uniref:Glycosyl transferase family 1 domain-containing protein n=1 Tax=Pedobacter ginsengiterrae TaxID=871696 RepID=A0ABP7NY33_9SPHI